MELTMTECKELLESTISELGMSSGGVYQGRDRHHSIINFVDITENWAVDKFEITECIGSPKKFVKLIKCQQCKALRRLKDKINAEIKKLGGTIDGPR